MEKPLVSIIIPCYKNLDKVYSTLDSIFRQKYPEIEIVLNDDGTPDYDKYDSRLREYTEKNRKENIKNIVINHLEKNVGTSKNCNHGIFLANGEYVKILSPEDELYDENVIDKCVDYARSHNARIVVGQTFVRNIAGEDTDNVRENISYRWKSRHGRLCSIIPSSRDIKYMQSLSKEKCNRILMSRCVISTPSVFFHMDLLKSTKGFSEDYRLIEDIPYWPLLAGNGEEFHFTDIIMVNYMLGGVSNSGFKNKEFLRDYLDILENIYIKNEVWGGVFNGYYKGLRKRNLALITGTASKSGLKYIDARLFSLWHNFKWLLLGSRL